MLYLGLQHELPLIDVTSPQTGLRPYSDFTFDTYLMLLHFVPSLSQDYISSNRSSALRARQR